MKDSTLPKTSNGNTSKKRALVLLLIAAGLALVIFFGLRTFHAFTRMRMMERMPLSTDVELIRGWMTIPYISDSYRVPAEYLAQACELPPPEKHENLADINQKIAPNQKGYVVECIKDAIKTFQQSHPTPPAGPQ